MALPDNTLSSSVVRADYISPYDRYTSLLTDFEAGGSAIGVSDDGLDYQVWSLTYVSDEESPDYGDFVIRAEDTGELFVPINVPDVESCCLAFNQNMDVFIGYELLDGTAKFYWYDTAIAGYTTTTLPAGSRSLQCCLDDHRITQTGNNDIILAYIRSGTLYYRQQRDRYTVEYTLKTGVGGADLHKVGMTKNLRLKFDVGAGRGVRLSEIVGDLCTEVDMTTTDFDVSALYPTEVRGFLTAGKYSAADAIRSLQKVYFFDFPEVDGKLVATLRGGDNVGTVEHEDIVSGAEHDLETAREQGVEFPYKVHLNWSAAETDYTPTKETAERRSPDVKAVSEITVDSAVNFERDEAAQRLDIFQKTAWAEFEGKLKTILPESYAWLNASDPVLVEVRPGTTKRMRLVKWGFGDGTFDAEFVIDRASAYTSGATGATTLTPSLPGPSLPGDTTWEFMDLPIIDGESDTLHYRVAARGDAGTAWSGAELQRLVGSDYEPEADIVNASLMGTLQEDFAFAPAEFIDTTNTILLALNDAPVPMTTADIIQGRGGWLIGNEIVQIRDWDIEGDYVRGSYITRGRLNTTAAAHTAGERAVYLVASTKVPTSVSLLDTTLNLRAPAYGTTPGPDDDTDHTFTGKSQEEWAPIDLVANQSGSDWVLSWTPRHRLGSSAIPIPSSNFYGWRLRFTVGGTTAVRDIESTTPEFTYTSAMQTEDFGSAQGSFDSVAIRGLNRLGGEGEALSEAVS